MGLKYKEYVNIIIIVYDLQDFILILLREFEKTLNDNRDQSLFEIPHGLQW